MAWARAAAIAAVAAAVSAAWLSPTAAHVQAPQPSDIAAPVNDHPIGGLPCPADLCRVVAFDPAFYSTVVPQQAVRVVANDSALSAHEGTVYINDTDTLFFISNRLGNLSTSDQRTLVQVMDLASLRITPLTNLSDAAAMSNGATRGPDGYLYLDEQGDTTRPAAVSRVDPITFERTVLTDGFMDVPFNSPNDIVVRRMDGTVWFTDPNYGYAQGFRPTPSNPSTVYVFNASAPKGFAQVRAMDVSMVKPNGIVFSPDERTLYVTDSGYMTGSAAAPNDWNAPRGVFAFDVDAGGSVLSNKRLLMQVPPVIPDGLKADTQGRLYTCTRGVEAGDMGGVQVYSPDGRLLGAVLVDGGCSNFAWAGPGFDRMYLMSETRVYAVQLLTQGTPFR